MSKHLPAEQPPAVSVAEPDRHQIAMRLAILKVAESRLKSARAALNAQGQATMRVGERLVAELPNGRAIGGVTYSRGVAAKPYIADEEKFRAWVEENHPEHIEHITRVRPAYQKVVLDASGQLTDRKTGEIIEVPGVGWTEGGAAHLTVTTDKGADEAVQRAWREGGVDLPAVLAIESSG